MKKINFIKKKSNFKKIVKFFFFRFFETYMVKEYPEIGEKINLKIIRAIRVLRPLKLVSRVPSELVAIYSHFIQFEIINLDK